MRPKIGSLLLLAMAACGTDAPRVGLVMSVGVVPAAAAAAAAPGEAAIELVVEQAPTSAAEPALAAAERLVERGVVAVVGHSNSAASLAASQVYNRAGVVQIAPTTTASAYAEAGEFSFRMVPSDEAQARLLARAAATLGRGAPVAVMYENDEYGWGLFRDLRAAVDSMGLEVVAAAGFLQEEGVAVFRSVLEALLRPSPAVLVWLGRGVPLDSLQQRLRDAGVVVVASDGMDSFNTYRNAGGVFTGTYFVRLLDPRVQEHAAAALPDSAAAAGAEGLLAYDAISLVRAAVASGARQGSEIRNYLHTLGRTRPAFRGVTGEIRFDEDRAVARRWKLARVTSDGVTAVELAP